MTQPKYIVAACLLALSFNVRAIIAPDSLRMDLINKLTIETDSQKRVDLMNELSYNYFDFNDTVAISYAQQALALGKKINYSSGVKYSTLLVGLGFYGGGRYDSAIVKFDESLAIEDAGSRENDVYAMALIGECLTATAKYSESRRVFQQTLPLAKETNSYWLPRVYLGMARIAINQWRNEEGIVYLDSADRLIDSSQIDYRRLELLALFGEVYSNVLQFDKSQAALNEMCSIAELLKDRYHRIKCDLQHAEFYHQRGNFLEALERIRSAMEITKAYYYPAQQAKIYFQAGDVYINLGEFDLSLEYFFKALEISEAIGLEAETAMIYAKIAWVFKEERKLDLAMEYARRSMELNEKLGSAYGISYVQNTIGLVYFLQEKYRESIREFQKSLKIRREINHTRGVVATIFNEALALEKLGENEKALGQLMVAIEQAKPIKNSLSFAYLYRGAAQLLMKLKRYNEAEDFLDKALELDSKVFSKLSLRNTYHMYSLLHEAKGNFKLALDYGKKYQVLDDSIFTDKSTAKIAELQATYDLRQKENEIEALKKQRVLQENLLQLRNAEIRDQKLQIYIAIFFLFVVSVFVAIMIFLYRKLNQTQTNLALVNSQLKEANLTVSDANDNLEQKVNERTSQLRQAYAELDTFFYRSSHDFRRPLTTLMGLADVAKITVKDEQAIELFKMVRVTAENLDKMLYKLQSISDIGAMELSYKNVIVRDLVENCLEKHAQEIEDLGVDVILNVQVEGAITTYPVLVSIIMDNLIENALNFSSRSEPYVKVNAYLKGDSLVIEVEDNGHGIPDDHKMNIFAMYFKATEKSKGNGLGLYIVSKAAEKLSATVRVETAYDKGSRFIVEIPDCVDSGQAVSA
ncbi:tetratricopeptide repeat protein [uncultured Imperialibacter sp.]|uniref:ATP-binding protein n=1 Tax=uncultured Imperialibacter sp. TaxID=1672639 RepID=UPI0030D7B794